MNKYLFATILIILISLQRDYFGFEAAIITLLIIIIALLMEIKKL